MRDAAGTPRLASSSAELATATVRLLRDRLARAARTYALERHDSGRVSEAYERVSRVAIDGAHVRA